MDIYILRHGIAENGYGLPDRERALTRDGREKLRSVLAMAIVAGAAAPSAIVTSPLRRAIETGDIAAELLGYRGVFQRTDALTPESSPDAVWREIAGQGIQPRLLLVGHEPLLSQVVAHLLGVPPLQVAMRPATFVAIEIAAAGGRPHGVLKFMLPGQA